MSKPEWGRIRFAGGVAFVVDEVLVPTEAVDAAKAELRGRRVGRPPGSAPDDPWRDEAAGRRHRKLKVRDAERSVQALRAIRIKATVNHVLFATGCCPCPQHPASATHPQANPLYANPLYANPLYANPLYANPLYANPLYANPLYANPLYANVNPNPATVPQFQASGVRRSTAEPAQQAWNQIDVDQDRCRAVRVAVLDTGWSHAPHAPGFEPQGLQPGGRVDDPDDDGDSYLDPVAGHGTFIAGLIGRLAPGCVIESHDVLSATGAGDEADIAQTLCDIADRTVDRPHLINLSFGGYSSSGMSVLQDAIDVASEQSIVVASAGNDGTCTPLFPAAFSNVVAVGATEEITDPYGRKMTAPAYYSNYGRWVDACANGTGVVSQFFNFDEFREWARWSGTSFAAPKVAAFLAENMLDGVGGLAGDWRAQALDALFARPDVELMGHEV